MGPGIGVLELVDQLAPVEMGEASCSCAGPAVAFLCSFDPRPCILGWLGILGRFVVVFQNLKVFRS